MVFAAPSHTVLLFSSSINIIIVRHGDRMTRVVLINSCAISSGPPHSVAFRELNQAPLEIVCCKYGIVFTHSY